MDRIGKEMTDRVRELAINNELHNSRLAINYHEDALYPNGWHGSSRTRDFEPLLSEGGSHPCAVPFFPI